MYSLRYAIAVGAAMLVAGASADAQLRRTTSTTYPDARTLPAGTCRVWLEGVPADRQPAATDCETARRSQPRNSRIIYGTRPTNVYGNRDPRSIPGTPQYDPRYDPRSSRYDPRLDPHNRRNDAQYNDSKSRKEREKLDRKQEKEREKQWKKSHKGEGRNEHGDGARNDDGDRRDRDRARDDRGGSYGSGTVRQQGCVDVNRDGICDGAQASRSIPRTVPQTVPQGGTRRVCVDANRDGKCDDGGPVVRTLP
jgi:hypothetical protein